MTWIKVVANMQIGLLLRLLFVAETVHGHIPDELNKPTDLEGYVFTKEVIRPEHKKCEHGCSVFDAGDIVAFEIENEGSDKLYIHIFNSHNGYYSHGFEFGDDEGYI